MEGYFFRRRRVWLEYSIFLPFLLVFLLDCYEGVSFFGLQNNNVSRAPKSRRGPVLLTPFNSLVLEIVAVSKAFVVASTAAMIAVGMKTVSSSLRSSKVFSSPPLSHEIRLVLFRRGVETSKFEMVGFSACVPEAATSFNLNVQDRS